MKQHGIENSNHEWFVCKIDQVKSAVIVIQKEINRHVGENVGLFSGSLTSQEYQDGIDEYQ